MKITTLIDNVVYGRNLVAEHGLSVLIENQGKKVLFDTGQSGNFILNAKVLGIDLSIVDAVIISHGHYDHAGGLEYFCRINRHAPVYIKEGVFDRKYHGKDRFIGVEYSDQIKNRMKIVEEITEIAPGLFAIPQIPIKNDWDLHFDGMFVKKQDEFKSDEFDDEQFLVIREKERISLISGCSHRGISNAIQSAINIFRSPVHLVLGGFHLKDADNEMTIKLMNEISMYKIARIGVCHCTGIERYSFIKESFKNKVLYVSTGSHIVENK